MQKGVIENAASDSIKMHGKREQELINKLKKEYARMSQKEIEAFISKHRGATFDELLDLIDEAIVGSECASEVHYDYGEDEDAKNEEVKWFDIEAGVADEDRIICGNFLLSTFKTTKCKRKAPHNQYECRYFHDVLDRRRRLTNHWYSAVPCASSYQGGAFVDPRNCFYKDKCLNAHTRNEIFYHYEFFRTKPCSETTAKCIRKDFCPFLHSQAADACLLEEEKKRAAEQAAPENKQPEQKQQRPAESDQKVRHERKASLCMYCTLALNRGVAVGRCTCRKKNRNVPGC